jgi:hypothetical protein
LIELPIKTVSTMNVREHWAVRAKRAKTQREATQWACKSLERVEPPLIITLTRIGTRKLDSDNLAASFKAIRDGVADWLGIDDGDERLTWNYAQEKGKYGVRIEFAPDRSWLRSSATPSELRK